MSNKRITVVGSGYVGMSSAILYSLKNIVTVLDIDEERVNKINDKKSTVRDELISKFLCNEKINLSSTLNKTEAFAKAEFIIVATPTNFNNNTKKFDTSSVEETISNILDINKSALIIIKSTVPIGFTDSMKKKYAYKDIVFSPEFLREGSALEDNLKPSRLIYSDDSSKTKEFVNVTVQSISKPDVNIIFMQAREAESVKLFSNTYLAMRVSFFNELDNFALENNLNAASIIKGISSDPRIGNYYNNPSFGYGGYCLPKDTKQLEYNFDGIPQSLITATIKSNSIRKNFIASKILAKKPKTVGIYRLVMKSNSDNFREAAIFELIEILQKNNIEILIYEPLVVETSFETYSIIDDLSDFINSSDIILANRFYEELNDVKAKVFTRDVFNKD